MKTPLALATAALALGVLAGCGGSDADSDYCKDLKSTQKEFGSLASSDVTQLDKVFKTFHKLADEAPSDISSDWKTLDSAMTKVEKAFSDAGLKASDFAKIQQGDIPDGVDVNKLQDVAKTYSEVTSEKFTKASAAIEKHAKDTCKVKLG